MDLLFDEVLDVLVPRQTLVHRLATHCSSHLDPALSLHQVRRESEQRRLEAKLLVLSPKIRQHCLHKSRKTNIML